MKLIELVSRDGKLSHTKIWANIAYFAATVGFIRMAWVGTASYDIWLVYLATVASAVTASKFLSLKYGSTPPASAAEEKT